MPQLEVGKVYHEGKTKWEDGTDFNYRSGVLELRMFFSGLTTSDIQQIREGKCYFAFAVVNDIIFFMFDFSKACPLSDNSYSIHMVGEDERIIPPQLEPNEMVPITIILVSSEDGIIRALRRIYLGHDFSNKLYSAIREQANKPFDKKEHYAAIDRVYQKYPTSRHLSAVARASCIVESKENSN